MILNTYAFIENMLHRECIENPLPDIKVVLEKELFRTILTPALFGAVFGSRPTTELFYPRDERRS